MSEFERRVTEAPKPQKRFDIELKITPKHPGHLDILFTDNDGHPGTLVEVEDAEGRSVTVGEWLHGEDGYWRLRLPWADGRVGS